jgi:hypothetical protein
VAFLCRYYGASRSGFYAWQRRGEALRVKADRELGSRIRRLHEDSRGTYGSPRVYQALRREGIRVGEKRVARLMREARLKARIARVYRRQPGLHRFFAKTPNLRLNQPPPPRIDQVWVGDITYLRVGRVLAVPGCGDGSVQPQASGLGGRPIQEHETHDAGTGAGDRLAGKRPQPDVPFRSRRRVRRSPLPGCYRRTRSSPA